MAEPGLSAEETAAHLGIMKDPVNDWMADQRMPACRVGRLWKSQVIEVDEWVPSGALVEGQRRANTVPVDGVEIVTRDGYRCANG